jgi:hypothetical protein
MSTTKQPVVCPQYVFYCVTHSIEHCIFFNKKKPMTLMLFCYIYYISIIISFLFDLIIELASTCNFILNSSFN